MTFGVEDDSDWLESEGDGIGVEAAWDDGAGVEDDLGSAIFATEGETDAAAETTVETAFDIGLVIFAKTSSHSESFSLL